MVQSMLWTSDGFKHLYIRKTTIGNDIKANKEITDYDEITLGSVIHSRELLCHRTSISKCINDNVRTLTSIAIIL